MFCHPGKQKGSLKSCSPLQNLAVYFYTISDSTDIAVCFYGKKTTDDKFQEFIKNEAKILTDLGLSDVKGVS